MNSKIRFVQKTNTNALKIKNEIFSRMVHKPREWKNFTAALKEPQPVSSRYFLLQQIFKKSNQFHFSSISKETEENEGVEVDENGREELLSDNEDTVSDPSTSGLVPCTNILEASHTLAQNTGKYNLKSVNHWNEIIVSKIGIASTVMPNYNLLRLSTVSLSKEEQHFLQTLPSNNFRQSHSLKTGLFLQEYLRSQFKPDALFDPFTKQLAAMCYKYVTPIDPDIKLANKKNNPDDEPSALLKQTIGTFTALPCQYLLITQPTHIYRIPETPDYVMSVPDFAVCKLPPFNLLPNFGYGVVAVGCEAKSFTGSSPLWQSVGHCLVSSLLNNIQGVNRPVWAAYFSPEYLDVWRDPSKSLPTNKACSLSFKTKGRFFGEDLLLSEDRTTVIQLVKRVMELATMENEQLVSEYPELALALGLNSK